MHPGWSAVLTCSRTAHGFLDHDRVGWHAPSGEPGASGRGGARREKPAYRTPRRSCTILPPTTVNSTRRSFISAAGTTRGLRSTTTRSA